MADQFQWEASLAQVPKLNREPLNQVAKSLLEAKGVQVEDSDLYCLQLLQWAVHEGGIHPPPRLAASLEAVVEAWPKDKAQFLFTGDPSVEGDEEHPELPPPASAEEYADRLLNQLRDQMRVMDDRQ